MHFFKKRTQARCQYLLVQSGTNVHLGLTREHLLLQIQSRLRLTMQHIYGHAQNLGNECADHAAALGTFAFGVESKRMHALDASFV